MFTPQSYCTCRKFLCIGMFSFLKEKYEKKVITLTIIKRKKAPICLFKNYRILVLSIVHFLRCLNHFNVILCNLAHKVKY